MDKELSFFKFKPSAWDNGNIQACSRDSKGLFTDLCSMYWARQGELPYALALQKQCNGDASKMQELIDHEVILINEGQIFIEFLDEQLTEFIEISKKRANAANKRWGANAMQLQCKSNAIREEKNKRREDNIYNQEIKELFDSVVVLFDEKTRPKTDAQRNAWLDTLEKCIRIDSYTPDQIKTIIKRMRMDDFWRTNFMSVVKLRQLNKEKVKYIDVFAAKVSAKQYSPSKVQSVAAVAQEVIDELTGGHE